MSLPADGASPVYDSNITPHHHLYDVDTGEVRDLPVDALQLVGLEAATPGMQLAGVDVLIRVRGLSVPVRA